MKRHDKLVHTVVSNKSTSYPDGRKNLSQLVATQVNFRHDVVCTVFKHTILGFYRLSLSVSNQ